MKNYRNITKDITVGIRELREAVPEVMQGFAGMSKAAMSDGVLDEKTKEFMALAIGVAGHCDGCIGFHTKALVRLGATREEFSEVLGVAVYMGGGPSLMYAAEAIQAYDEFSSEKK